MKNTKKKIKKFKGLLEKRPGKGKPVSVFDWECPPRKKRVGPKGERWFDFDLPFEKVLNGQKIDEFTELPKIITKEKETRQIISAIERYGCETPFTKLVADTNWLYVYPGAVEKTGIKRLQEIAQEFKSRLQKKCDQMFGKSKVRVINFTRLQAGFKQQYENAFDKIIKNYKRMVPKTIIKKWESRIAGHVGLSEKERMFRNNLAKRVIASYAAEGVIFSLLDQKGTFPNPIWVSVEESELAGETTEILTKRKEIPPFPKIFLS